MDVLLYSGNLGKIKEIKEILKNSHFNLHIASDLNVSTGIDETGLTFVENAIIKARDGSKQANMACMADDSGLIVDCLGGQPGVFSARYAGKTANNSQNIAKLLDELSTVEPLEKSARFICCIVYLRYHDDPCPLICTGTCEGLITNQPSGGNGFGYDPVFYLPEYKKTMAELPKSLKNTIGHRSQALNLLKEKLNI